MKRKMKKITKPALAALAVLMALTMALSACGGGAGSSGGSAAGGSSVPGSSAEAPDAAADAYTVTDLAGRTTEFAVSPTRALAIAGPAYEKVFLLGQADKLAGAHFLMVERPWVKETNPAISAVAAIESPGEPNVEALLALDPDVAFFFDYADSLAAIEDAGIPVVVVQNSERQPDDGGRIHRLPEKRGADFRRHLRRVGPGQGGGMGRLFR